MGEMDFGPFRLDVATGRLLRDGIELTLRPQAFHALRALLQNRGRHMGYNQMIHEAWEGTFVSRHTVAVTVGEAKKVLKEYGSWIHYRPKLGYCLDIPRSDDLIRKGWHFSKRYTREGFEKALDCFQQAASNDAAEFRAFEGMSLSYLMLGAYNMRPPRQMYPRFLDAHARAAAIRGLTPELRADRAHAWHVFERRFEDAEYDLLHALCEDSKLITTYGHLALLYATSGRFEEAFDILAKAYEVDALWPLLPAMEVLVRLCHREFDSAVACGKKAVDLHPYLPLGRHLYAQALEQAGQLEEALEQYRLSCVISPDLPWLRAQEAACLANAGMENEALEILEELQWLRLADYVDAYSMAILFETLGQRDATFQELERACEENSATLFILDVDPKLDALRDDPRFERIRRQVFGNQSRTPQLQDTLAKADHA